MESNSDAGRTSHLPHLPDELWITILEHVDELTLWHTIRATHPKLRVEAEKIAVARVLPHLSLALTYTLGSGTRHRWYDVRATIAFSYASMNKHNPDFARFEVCSVHPPSFHDRALEKWRPLCARGLDSALEWQISDQRVTYTANLSKLVGAEHGSLWCDWREVLAVWLHKLAIKSRMLQSD